MFPPSKNKGLAAIMLAAPQGKESEMKPEHEPMADKAPLHAAAGDILAAIEHKSQADLADALSSFMELCEHDESEEKE